MAGDRFRGRRYWSFVAAGALAVALVAVGCSPTHVSPTQPLATNFTLSVDGVSQPITAGTAVRNNPGFAGVTVGCVVNNNGTSMAFNTAIPEGTGVYGIGPGQKVNGKLDVTTGGVMATYFAFDTVGSGSVTVTALSATMITGSFDLVLGADPVMVPQPAIPARHAVGTFNVVIGS